MAGLVTRVGQWLDSKWEASATATELKALEAKATSGLVACERDIKALVVDVEKIKEAVGAVTAKDIADMKTRLEKLEMYTGFTRKPDPLGNAQVKSAFQL